MYFNIVIFINLLATTQSTVFDESSTTSNNTNLNTNTTNTNATTVNALLTTTFMTNSPLENIILNSVEQDNMRRQMGGQNDFRRQLKKRRRETSSSSGEAQGDTQSERKGGNKESLEMGEDSSIPYSWNMHGKSVKKTKKIKLGTVSSQEYEDGWRKWHRRCWRCPEIEIKFRDPNIKWICGAYQRARRSFKSLCMMHFRNCQDGTMFVKIGDHKCQEKPGKDLPSGLHFFYDYKAPLDTESSETGDASLGDSDSSVSNTFSITMEEEERKMNFLRVK